MWKHQVARRVFGARGFRDASPSMGPNRFTEVDAKEVDIFPVHNHLCLMKMLNSEGRQFSLNDELKFHSKVHFFNGESGMHFKTPKFTRPKSPRKGLFHKLQPKRRMSDEYRHKLKREGGKESGEAGPRKASKGERETGGGDCSRASEEMKGRGKGELQQSLLGRRVSPSPTFLIRKVAEQKEKENQTKLFKKGSRKEITVAKSGKNYKLKTEKGKSKPVDPFKVTLAKGLPVFGKLKMYTLRELSKTVEEAPLKKALIAFKRKKHVRKLVEDKTVLEERTRASSEAGKRSLCDERPSCSWLESNEQRERRKRDMLHLLQNGRKERELLRKICLDTRPPLERIPIVKDGETKRTPVRRNSTLSLKGADRPVEATRKSLLEKIQPARVNPLARKSSVRDRLESAWKFKKATDRGAPQSGQNNNAKVDLAIAKKKNTKKDSVPLKTSASCGPISPVTRQHLKHMFRESDCNIRPRGLLSPLHAKWRKVEERQNSTFRNENSKEIKDLFWSLQSKRRDEKMQAETCKSAISFGERRRRMHSSGNGFSFESGVGLIFGERGLRCKKSKEDEEPEYVLPKKNPFPWIDSESQQAQKDIPINNNFASKPKRIDADENRTKLWHLERIPPIQKFEKKQRGSFQVKNKEDGKGRTSWHGAGRTDIELALELVKEIPRNSLTDLVFTGNSGKLIPSGDTVKGSVGGSVRPSPSSPSEKNKLTLFETLQLGKQSQYWGNRNGLGCCGRDVKNRVKFEDLRDDREKSPFHCKGSFLSRFPSKVQGSAEEREASPKSKGDEPCKGRPGKFFEDAEGCKTLFERLQLGPTNIPLKKRRDMGGGSEWPEELFSKPGFYFPWQAYSSSPAPAAPPPSSTRRPNQPRLNREHYNDFLTPRSKTPFSFKSPGFTN